MAHEIFMIYMSLAEEIVWFLAWRKMQNLHGDDLLCLSRFAWLLCRNHSFLHTSHYSRIVTQFATQPRRVAGEKFNER